MIRPSMIAFALILLTSCVRNANAEPVPVEEGVVADPRGGRVYVLSAKGQLEAVNALTGAVMWRSDEADVPLSSDGKTGQALLALDRGKALLSMDPLSGRVRHRCAPDGVPLAMNRTYQSSAILRGLWDGGDTYVFWNAGTWYGGGPRPSSEMEAAARQSKSGAAKIDMASCEATMLSAQEAAAIDKKAPKQPPEKPDSLGPWTIAGVTVELTHRREGKDDVVTLRRKLTSGTEITTEVGRRDFHLPTYASADGRHFVAIDTLPTTKDNSRSRARVTLWDAAKAKPIARFETHEHIHRFVVMGQRIIAKGMPDQRIVSQDPPKSITRGYRIRAIDTQSGRELWAHDLESLMPKAGPPGTPPAGGVRR